MVKQRGETLTYNKWIQKTIGTITNRPIRNAGRSYNIKHIELLTQSKKNSICDAEVWQGPLKTSKIESFAKLSDVKVFGGPHYTVKK